MLRYRTSAVVILAILGILSIGPSLLWAADTGTGDEATWDILVGDDYGRINPVWWEDEGLSDDFLAARWLIPNGSTTYQTTPIDVRGIDSLRILWVAGNPSDTTTTASGDTLNAYGSPFWAADETIGGSTPVLSDYDASILPIEIPSGRIQTAVLAANASVFSVTSSTPGLQILDTRGLAWVSLKFSIASATSNVWVGGQRRR